MKHPVKAILALLIRLYFGYEFLTAGLEKYATGFGAKSVLGTLQRGLGQTHDALLKSGGPSAAAHPNVMDWWAWVMSHILVPSAPLFAFLVKTGEVLVGLGLILGCLTTLAAFFGMVMNMSFLLSGALSSNAEMVLGFMFLLAWGAASYEIGVDRFLMKKLLAKFPKLSTSWVRRGFPVEE